MIVPPHAPYSALALGLALLLTACSEPSHTPDPSGTSGAMPSVPAVESNAAMPPGQVQTDKPMAPADERLEHSLTALGDGNYTQAMELTGAVLTDHPGHSRALFLHALALHKLKRYAEARIDFQAAADSPQGFDGAEALPYYLGWCTYWLGDFDAARGAFQAHLDQVGEPDSFFGLGIIALELGELETAQSQLDLAAEGFNARLAAGDMLSARDVAKTYTRLADVDLANDQDEAAAEHLKSALELDADRPAVWFKLYNVSLALGDQELAIMAKREYEKRSPNTNDMTPMGANQ